MSINLTDELIAKTKKGKLASAKQVYLNGDQENLQQVGEKTHQLEQSIKDIAASGGASVASAVTYDNATSGMTSVTAQGAIDELAAKDAAQDTEIAKKANSSDVDSQMNTEQTRVNAELDKKFDKENVAQELGDSEDKVVSQKMYFYSLLNTKCNLIYNKGTGTEITNCINNCLTHLNESKNFYVEKEDPILKNFLTYYYTNPNTSTKLESYVYAEFKSIGNFLFRSVAIFDESNNLVYQSREYGKCMFLVPPGHTIYISAKLFDVIPRFDVTFVDDVTYINRINEAYLQNKIVDNISNKVNLTLSQITSHNIEKSFITPFFLLPSKEANIGNQVGTCIEDYIPKEFATLSSIENKEDQTSNIKGYVTYIYKNTTVNNTYVYADYYNNANYLFMACGLYDKNQNLIKSSRQDGKLMFEVLAGYTLVLAGASFNHAPVLIDNATRLSCTPKAFVEEIVKSFLSPKKIKISCWGDSLTMGTGSYIKTNLQTVIDSIKKEYPDLTLTSTSTVTYPLMIQNLVGSEYNVVNCGVGGENINTIASRIGACSPYIKDEIVLPKDISQIQIGDYKTRINSDWGLISPLLQGDDSTINPCYVNGIECSLTWTGSSYNDSDGKYMLQRKKAGDRDVTLPAKTPIIFKGTQICCDTDIAVIWCWQNGGYSTDTELIEKLDKIISHIGTTKYLLIGLHTGTLESRQEQEEALTTKYGDKYFNWRQYISTNALYDFGITPTKDDLSAMEVGAAPPSLKIDNTHFGSAGYAILGYKIVERFKILGYI